MSKTKTAIFAKALIGSAILVTIAATHVANAAKLNFEASKDTIYTPVYGKALPPMGHVNFCARNRAECKSLGGTTKRVVLTEENWKILHEVNNYANKTIMPITDQDLYDVPELWAFPTNAGDCEDYVLQKKRYLEGLGFPAESLLITVVLDQNNKGHAVLTVRTDRGDFALDNMRDEIRRWDKTGYTYIKRQSQKDPKQWVSLTNRGVRVSQTTVAGRN